MLKYRKIKFKIKIIDFFGFIVVVIMYMYLLIRFNYNNWKYFFFKIERNMIYECGIKVCVLFIEYFFFKREEIRICSRYVN